MTTKEQAKLKAILYELAAEVFVDHAKQVDDDRYYQITSRLNSINECIKHLFDKPHKTNAKRRRN